MQFRVDDTPALEVLGTEITDLNLKIHSKD